ncbi:hypothetical protein [Bradyrhizobium neotropicale]|nr:hypothetical protein [Bradyrhizobium neotropicale]
MAWEFDSSVEGVGDNEANQNAEGPLLIVREDLQMRHDAVKRNWVN